MSKRFREGPVAIHGKRQRLPFDTVAPMFAPRLKRKRDDVDEVIKRFRASENIEQTTIGKKRSAECFDEELQHLEKRMRATVPTAEEAIAFLLPHIVRMRKLYTESQQKVAALTCNNNVIRKTCAYLIQEKKKLESEVALANYRFAISGPKPFAVESRA
tara:strand:+ start:252 stop:728 length:477 start_codon:yes stop_codon:yes gene_type:complete